MNTVIRSAAEATPERLTTLLKRQGALPQGEVVAVQAEQNPAFNSVLTHLALTCSPDATPAAPRHLVLKLNLQADWGKEAGRAEVAFYRHMAARSTPMPMIVPCYSAEYDPNTGNSHLLLQDLSDTHHVPLTRDQQLTPGSNVPNDTDADLVVQALARFHACWWEHALLGTELFPVTHWFRDDQGYAQFMERRTLAYRELIAAEADWFPAAYAARYDAILAALPRLWERCWRPRIVTRRHITLTHGDSYFANFLVPNPQTGGETYLLDWQSPEALWGSSDLANMLVTFMSSAQRQEQGREERLLRLYLATLQQSGVTGYTWGDLLLDYRLSILDWALVPLQDRRDGSRRDYWWPKMRYLMEAYEDWQCDETVDPSPRTLRDRGKKSEPTVKTG